MPRSRPRPRAKTIPLLVAGLCCVSALAACGGSKQAAATTATTATTSGGANPAQTPPSHAVSGHVVTATSGTVTASMNAAGHSPRVGVSWPVRLVVKSNDKAAKAEVRYEYMFGGQVVAHRSHYRFTGGFHDTFNWPASAVGYPLTFRAVILSEGVTLNLDYPVQVRR